MREAILDDEWDINDGGIFPEFINMDKKLRKEDVWKIIQDLNISGFN